MSDPLLTALASAGIRLNAADDPEADPVSLKQNHFETKGSGNKAASRSTILQTVIDKPEGGKNDTA
jgi:hypothetical protein